MASSWQVRSRHSITPAWRLHMPRGYACDMASGRVSQLFTRAGREYGMPRESAARGKDREEDGGGVMKVRLNGAIEAAE